MEVKAIKVLARNWLKSLGPVKRNASAIEPFIKAMTEGRDIMPILDAHRGYDDKYRYPPKDDLIFDKRYFTPAETRTLKKYYAIIKNEYNKRVISLMKN